MTRPRRKDAKSQALKDHGSLHPRPERVSDELFLREEFFDPRDLVQVKYEMLRRVRIDRQSIQNAARAFGLSRPTFYQAQTAYGRAGLAGLLPAKRGPRRAHKLSESVVAFLRQELASDPSLQAPELARRVRERFGFAVHPRSIQRALARSQKKTE
jgi:transposase